MVAQEPQLALPQQESQARRDDGYRSGYVPKSLPLSVDDAVKDDPAGRREAQLEQFGGEFTAEFMESLTNAANAQAATYGPAGRGGIKAPAGGHWTNVGPYRSAWIQNGNRLTESDTGRVRTFLVHPTNADIVYVLKSSGGLWKTTNFSHPRPNWQPKTDNILSTSSGGAALGKNPETIYFGSGDPFDPGVGGAMYRSTDGGETWGPGQSLVLRNAAGAIVAVATIILDIKVDTSGAQDVVLVATNAGLFRSLNGGDTYSPAVSGGLHWSIQKTSAGWLVAGTNGGSAFFTRLATAGGAAVLDFGAGGINATGTPAAAAGRMTLGVGVPGDAVVYAFAAKRNNTRQKDLFKSINGGATFAPIGLGDYVTTLEGTPPAPVTKWVGKVPQNPYQYQTTMDIMFDQPSYNQMLLVDPSDPSRNTVFIGGQFSSAKTTNGGGTWRVVSAWLAQNGLPYVHADHHAAAVASIKGKQILLFGGDGGLFTSDDGGATFSSQKNDGMSSYLIYALTGNPAHPDDVLIGLQDNGTRWRVGPTGTYNQVFGGDGFGVAWSQAEDRISLGSVYYSFIIRNRRNPANTQAKWEVGWTGIEEFNDPATSYFRSALATPSAAADPTGLTFFHRTQFKLYRTTNGAGSWHKVFETFDPNPPPTDPPQDPPPPVLPRVLLRAGMHPIGISPDDLQHFGVLGNSGHAFFTADGGSTWSRKIIATVWPPPPPIPPAVPAPIEPDAEIIVLPGWPGFNATLAYASNQTLYIGNEAPVGTTNRVIKSTDGGNTWAHANGLPGNTLPPVPINKLIVSPRDPASTTLYAATWLGVYETTDGGANWHLFGSGLPMVNVSDLYMPPDGSYLRVSTYGRGVWEIKF
jgi:photosystem II stability/assembly factor-like uncharacterized protein